MGSLETWTTRGIPDTLASEHRVIVLDQRGFGQSTQLDDPASYGLQMADDVIRLLDHLQIRRAHLVGHSMGGVVATNVASRYPDRVLSATVIAPPEYADAQAWERANLRWASDFDRGAPSIVETIHVSSTGVRRLKRRRAVCPQSRAEFKAGRDL